MPTASKLAAPAGRVRGQFRVGLLGLALGARDGVEALALEPLHLTALLVDREQRLDPFRPTGRGPDVAHHPAGRGGPEGGVAQQDHAARPASAPGSAPSAEPRPRESTPTIISCPTCSRRLIASTRSAQVSGSGVGAADGVGLERGRGAGRGGGRPGRGRRSAERRGRELGARDGRGGWARRCAAADHDDHQHDTRRSAAAPASHLAGRTGRSNTRVCPNRKAIEVGGQPMSSITSVSPRTLGGRDPGRPRAQHRARGRRGGLRRPDRAGVDPALVHSGAAVPADLLGAAGRCGAGQPPRSGFDGPLPAGRHGRRARGSPRGRAAGSWPPSATWSVSSPPPGWSACWPSAARTASRCAPAGMMVVGNLVIYVFGVTGLVLMTSMTPAVAVAKGVLPFLLGDAIKIIFAAALLPATWKLVGSREVSPASFSAEILAAGAGRPRRGGAEGDCRHLLLQAAAGDRPGGRGRVPVAADGLQRHLLPRTPQGPAAADPAGAGRPGRDRTGRGHARPPRRRRHPSSRRAGRTPRGARRRTRPRTRRTRPCRPVTARSTPAGSARPRGRRPGPSGWPRRYGGSAVRSGGAMLTARRPAARSPPPRPAPGGSSTDRGPHRSPAGRSSWPAPAAGSATTRADRSGGRRRSDPTTRR